MAITVGGSNGHFELNVFKPMIANALLHVCSIVVYCTILLTSSIQFQNEFLIGFPSASIVYLNSTDHDCVGKVLFLSDSALG